LIIKDLLPRSDPCVKLAFQPIQVSALPGRTFNHERTVSSEATSAPLVGDYRVSAFRDALTFPEAHQGNRSQGNKGRQVDSSLVCFRSQALEFTSFDVDNAV
jgi:hypothetical protein